MANKQQAYRTAPWRKQMGHIFSVVGCAAAIAVLILAHLAVSEKMTEAKLNIEVLQEQRSEYSRQVANRTTDEGVLTAFEEMKKRAEEAGFTEIDFSNEDLSTYLVLDGYTGTGIKTENKPVEVTVVSGSLLKPEYTQSLQQVLFERIAAGIKSYEVDY